MQRIRSYVLRQGRISNAQRHALEVLRHHTLPYQAALLDLDAIYGRTAPKILEIGFGMGETTRQIALAHPEQDFLGVEVHSPGVGSLLKQINEFELTNLKIIQHDAVSVLMDMIELGCLDGVHIFFPDPWPKKRHHKRRLIQADFVQLLTQRIKPGGYLHIATDWQEYAEHSLAVLQQSPSLENTAVDFAARPDYRPYTKFEQRGLKLGHGVWDIIFRVKR